MFFRFFKILFIITVLSFSAFAGEQKNEEFEEYYDKTELKVKKLDDSFFDKYKNDEDFNYEKKEAPVKSIWDYLSYLLNKLLEPINGKVTSKIIEYFLYALFIFGVIFIFWRKTFKKIFYKNKSLQEIQISEIDEDINKIEIEDLIKQSVKKKDFRLAIRYYYLKLLKQLSEKEIIKWEKNKTNKDYIYELKNTEYYNDFKTFSNLYSYIWYGDFHIDETDFKAISTDFEKYINKLSVNE